MVLQMIQGHELEDHAFQYILMDKELLWAILRLFFKKKDSFIKNVKTMDSHITESKALYI